MPAIACLIADPAHDPLDLGLVRDVARALGTSARWLGEAEAVEFATDAVDPPAGRARLAPLLADAPVDWAVLSSAHRRKRLLLCDMDSTVIQIECIDELAEIAGIRAEIAAITQSAMRGDLDFAQALRARVRLLAGLPEAAIRRVIDERLRLTPGAVTLVRTMRAHGARTALVSGGFTPFTRHVQALCGFDQESANELAVAGGRLTGELLGPLRGPEAKLATLLHLRERLALTASETMAVGDGANDAPMLEAAGLGVAFRAHPRLRQQADVCVDRGDLTACLFLQGYRREEFVTV